MEARDGRPSAGWAHADLDSFFASVEQLLDPDLAGRPVAVAGTGRRGAVASSNYEARHAGVRAGMATGEARRVCSDLVVVSPRIDTYRVHSDKVMAVLAQFGPITQVSIDEAFIDTARAPDILRWGRDVRAAVAAETGLNVSVGAGRSRIVAKVASGEAKPDGLLWVPAEESEAFLGPLEVRRLPGVGPVARRRLEGLGAHTVADLAALDLDAARSALGSSAARLVAAARGEDLGGIETRPVRSHSRFRTFETDVVGAAAVSAALQPLVDEVARELATTGHGARTVTVKLRTPRRRDVSKSVTAATPIASSEALRGVVDGILATSRTVRTGVRGAGVAASNLEDVIQDDLFSAVTTAGGYGIGTNVRHPTFGEGVVVWLSSDGTAVTVRFGDGRSRDLDTTIAKLTPAS